MSTLYNDEDIKIFWERVSDRLFNDSGNIKEFKPFMALFRQDSVVDPWRPEKFKREEAVSVPKAIDDSFIEVRYGRPYWRPQLFFVDDLGVER